MFMYKIWLSDCIWWLAVTGKETSYPTTTWLRRQPSFARFIPNSFGVRESSMISKRIATHVLLTPYSTSSPVMNLLRLCNHIYVNNSSQSPATPWRPAFYAWYFHLQVDPLPLAPLCAQNWTPPLCHYSVGPLSHFSISCLPLSVNHLWRHTSPFPFPPA